MSRLGPGRIGFANESFLRCLYFLGRVASISFLLNAFAALPRRYPIDLDLGGAHQSREALLWCELLYHYWAGASIQAVGCAELWALLLWESSLLRLHMAFVVGLSIY